MSSWQRQFFSSHTRMNTMLTGCFLLSQTLSEVSPFQRDRVAAQLMQPGYVRKLLELFSVRFASALHPPQCNEPMGYVTEECQRELWG